MVALNHVTDNERIHIANKWSRDVLDMIGIKGRGDISTFGALRGAP